MRAPLSWLREFAEIPNALSADEIADAFVRVGFEVEAIEKQGADLTGPLVVGKVITIEEITEFKKPIRWVGLDCAEGSTRYVICGATNFAVGDLVVVALPGAVLPGNFAIAQRETYGKISNGMICSTKELALGDEHDGILILPPHSAQVGEDAIELLEICDVIFDIAVNPDRGYALSMRGLAREIAAAVGVAYKDPVHSIDQGAFPLSGAGTSIALDDPNGASVVVIRTLENFNASAPSPLWMRRRLEKCGMRAISLAVDITNYVMLELGQPLHAFDRAKIEGGLQIRRARAGEKIKTLDGIIRNLIESDLLVSDEKQGLALAGTMGGENSEIDSETRSIALEGARFSPLSIAKSARHHKLSTEASRRFERGVDPSLAGYATARAAALLMEFGGATHLASAQAGEPIYSAIFDFNPEYVAQVTGAQISSEMVEEKILLIGADIAKVTPTHWRIDPPSWRSDLLAPIDLVEEVARLVGYDAIPSTLPPGQVSPGLTDFQRRRRAIAENLVAQGLTEVQTFPFLSQATMEKMGFIGEHANASAFRLANPLSEQLPLLRTDLLPGLIEAAQRNLSRGARNFSLFEIGTIFKDPKNLPQLTNPSIDERPSQNILDQIYAGVPEQPIYLGAILVGKAESDSWRGKGRSFDWSDAVAFAESVLASCSVKWDLQRATGAPWHPGRSVELCVAGRVIGYAGEIHPRILAEFGLPPRAGALIINLSALPERSITRATALATMPIAVQDIALIVDENVLAADVAATLRAGAGELLESLELFDRYDQIGAGKISLAFTLTFRAADRTLTTAEVTAARESAVEATRVKMGAVLRDS